MGVDRAGLSRVTHLFSSLPVWMIYYTVALMMGSSLSCRLSASVTSQLCFGDAVELPELASFHLPMDHA